MKYLVGALEHEWIIFPIILGISSSQLTNSIIFQRGGYTTNQDISATNDSQPSLETT